MVKVPALLFLVAGTCWAVASLVSVWLVPPYLVALGWILFPTAGSIPRPGRLAQDQDQVDTTGSGPSTDPNWDQVEGTDGGGSASKIAGKPSLSADAVDPGLALDSPSTTATATAKPKRARSRARKVKPIVEPVEVAPATWKEIGPGKFVRVETPSTNANATEHGPHLLVEPEPSVTDEADPTVAGDELTGSSPNDGLTWPDHSTLPNLDQDLSTLGSLAGPLFGGAELVVGVSYEVFAPTEVRDGSLVDPVAETFDARPDPAVPCLIDPTADGNAPQVGVAEVEDQGSARLAEFNATRLDHESAPELRNRDAAALMVDSTDALSSHDLMPRANCESTEVVDTEVEEEWEWQETAVEEELEESCGSGIASGYCLEVPPASLDVDEPPMLNLPTRPRRPRVESSRLTDRRALRGFRLREDRPADSPTNARRFIRRVVGRPRQISRTSKPRSPPAPI